MKKEKLSHADETNALMPGPLKEAADEELVKELTARGYYGKLSWSGWSSPSGITVKKDMKWMRAIRRASAGIS